MIFKQQLKQLRTKSGMSQEQLADRLGVTRQAVVKWETGIGMPDIDNLQQLANVFGVGLDELLDYKNNATLSALREDVTLTEHPDGWQNELVRQKYPHADITQLTKGVKMTWWRHLLDMVTVGPGTIEMVDLFGGALKERHYLVEHNNRQWIVSITKEYLESRELVKPFAGKTKVVDSHRYDKARPL
ncbi:MAG: helix-turn-helix transcriptional regulator [Candidatus Saccharimonadales bacterium]